MANSREPEDLDRDLEITMSPPETAETPIPPPPPGSDVGTWGPGAPLGIPNQAVASDPSGTTQIGQRPQTAFDRDVPGAALSGHFDAWVGEVITAYPSGDPFFGDTNSVAVIRSVVQWSATGNEPSAEEFPTAWSRPATSPVIARPFPPRHDQPKYIAEAGDIVTVLTGTDGIHWYIKGELGFVGKVVKKETSVQEDTTGGAGLRSLKVRWQSMTGDPDGGSFDGATIADVVEDDGSTTVDFEPVLVIKPDEQNHGYRCGDLIWVQRRGRYFFAEAAQEIFAAVVHNAGPDGEADFATSDYWLKEQSGTVTYTNNEWSISYADRNALGPDSGRERRWIQARNTAEAGASHSLPVDSSIYVTVHIFSDPGSTKGEAWYFFDRTPDYVGDGVWVGNEVAGKAQPFVDYEVHHLTWDAPGVESIEWIGWQAADVGGGDVVSTPPSSGGYIKIAAHQFHEMTDANNHGELSKVDDTARYIATVNGNITVFDALNANNAVNITTLRLHATDAWIHTELTDAVRPDVTLDITHTGPDAGSYVPLTFYDHLGALITINIDGKGHIAATKGADHAASSVSSASIAFLSAL